MGAVDGSLATSTTPKLPTEQKSQTVCKPGSVPAKRRWMTIHLGRPLPDASRNLPGRQCGDAPAPKRDRPYSVLLPVGFTVPRTLPPGRCALTAPFHPYPGSSPGRFAFCGTFPGVAPAGRYPAPYLRGARTFLPQHLSDSYERSSDRLAGGHYIRACTAAIVRRVSSSATPSTRDGRKWR